MAEPDIDYLMPVKISAIYSGSMNPTYKIDIGEYVMKSSGSYSNKEDDFILGPKRVSLDEHMIQVQWQASNPHTHT